MSEPTSRPLINSVLPPLEELLKQATDLTRGVRFDSRHRQHLVAVCVLGSILELALAVFHRLKARDGTSPFILLRSMLEAHIDLLNIAKDEGYADVMHAAHLEQQKRMIDSAKNRGTSNPFLGDMSTNSDVDQHLTWIGDELQALQQRGVKPLSVKKRFVRADSLDLYEGPYALLCWHSHNNLDVIERRHLEDVDGELNVSYFQEPRDRDVEIIADALAGLVSNSVIVVSSLLESERTSDAEELNRRRDAVRSVFGGS